MEDTSNAPSPEESFSDTSSPDTSSSFDSSSDSGGSFLEGLFSAADTASDPNADPNPEPSQSEDFSDSEPTAKVEDNDPDLEDLPKAASAKTKADWKSLKAVKKQIEQERDDLRKELESLKSQPKTVANDEEIARVKQELEQYKTQVAEYDQRMALVDVKQSREYQENIAKPLANAESLIQAFATKYELSIPDIAKAAMQPNILERNSLLAEMVVGMNDFDKFEFKKVVDEAQQLFTRAQMVEQNAQASRKYAEEQWRKQQEEQATQQKQAFDSAADKVWQGIAKRMPFISEDAATAEKLARDARDSDLASATPEIQAYARYASVLLPTVLERFEQQQAKIKELEGAIAKRSGATPRAKSGAVPTTPTEEPEDFMAGLDALLK
jgi:hypothetical protein